MRKTLMIFASITVTAIVAQTVHAQVAPAAAAILRANRTATGGMIWKRQKTLETKYSYFVRGQNGEFQSLTDLGTGYYIDTIRFGHLTHEVGFDGTHVWVKGFNGIVRLLHGDVQRVLGANKAFQRAHVWWEPGASGARITATTKTGHGATFNVLTVTPKGGETFKAWFGAGSHLLLRTVETLGSHVVTTTFSAYSRVHGVMLPRKIAISWDAKKKDLETLTLMTATFLPKISEATFRAPKIAPRKFILTNGTSKTQIPVTLVDNLILGNVKVDGKGPFPFIFNTGGGDIITPKLEHVANLQPEGRFPGRPGVVRVGTLRIGSVELRRQNNYVVSLNALEKVEGVSILGMIGYDELRRFVVRIDYGARTITLIDPKRFDPKLSGMPVKFQPGTTHVAEVEGTFEGLPARFAIDTASPFELMLSNAYARKIGFRAKHLSGVNTVFGWEITGPAVGYVTMGKSLTIGTIHVKHFVTIVPMSKSGTFYEKDIQGVIGGGILKRFIATFDFHRDLMYLKPRDGIVADTGTYDHAGMWFDETHGGFEIVDVIKDGPAQAAGLRKGDMIIAVDGKPARAIKLYRLRQLLRDDAPGKIVDFTVRHDRTTADVKVVLRNLF